MKKTGLVRLWLLPLFVFVSIVAVVAATAVLYHKSETSHQNEKAVQISNAISKNMSREIEYRLTALKLAASSVRNTPAKSEFEKLAQMLQDEYSGFFAVNFVSTDGVITLTYPAEKNKAALGKNLLARQELRQYLLDAKADGQPRVGHRIFAYQKIYGVPIWIPLYDRSRKFIGWMNGLLSIDLCLNNYMQDTNLKNVTARLRWQHPSHTSVLEYNWDNSAVFQTSHYKILNQPLAIDLALAKTPLDHWRNTLYITSLILRISLLLIIFLFLILLTRSKFKLQSINEQLSFKNNMLSSLSHDLANPLTSLYLLVDAAVANGEVSPTFKNKSAQLMKTIQGMLKSARLLHSLDTGANTIPVENVNVLATVKAAVELVEQMAFAKGVVIEISSDFSSDLVVKANDHTLVNNVLANALTNAIKFSPPKGRISISHGAGSEGTYVIITDQGSGLSPADLQKFELLSSITTRAGTYGEQGTGLGLLQISGFMKMYGGYIKLENNKPTGTKLTLVFPKS